MLPVHAEVWRMASLFVVALAVGCGGDRGRQSLSGAVTLDGNPLPSGRISFRPIASGQTAGAPIRDGEYQLRSKPGLAAGEYRVVITAERLTGRTVIDDETGDEEEEFEQYLPPRYNRNTTLRIAVRADGPNENHFELATDK